MRLFIFGNINSGKTTLIEKIKVEYPRYHVLKLDDYRIEHCDGSVENEMQAWVDFPKEVLKYEDVIVEFTGFGHVAENLIELLDRNSCVIVKVNSTVEECLQRLKDKDFGLVPYPKFESAETLEETISRLGKDLEEGKLESLWQDKAIAVLTYNPNDILPLKQYHYIFKMKKILEDVSRVLFLSGSAARCEMTFLSDVDLFCLTDSGVDEIMEILRDEFEFVDSMENEIVIRDNGMLIELNVISDIEEARVFYRETRAKDARKTILVEKEPVLEKLVEFQNEKVDEKELLSYTVSRLRYYLASLENLISKNDEYKYYFHNNIVIHECIRLKAMEEKRFERNYLPLNSKQYFSDEEWRKLIYIIGDDMEKHLESIKPIVTGIIADVEIHIKENYPSDSCSTKENNIGSR